MGIKNSRRRSHDIDAVQPDEPDIWEEGKFTPDPDCDRSPVRYRTVTGPDGLPTNARTIYVDWRKSGISIDSSSAYKSTSTKKLLMILLRLSKMTIPSPMSPRDALICGKPLRSTVHTIFATYIPMGIIRQADCRWTSSSSIGWILLRM